MDCFVAEPVIGRAFARPVDSSQRRSSLFPPSVGPPVDHVLRNYLGLEAKQLRIGGSWRDGADGTLPVEIDTALAKAVHPDQDHTYTITAEAVDESRRTIVGTGTVLSSAPAL